MELDIEFVYRLNCGKELFILAQGGVSRNDNDEWEVGDDLMIRVTADYYEAPWRELFIEHALIEEVVMQKLVQLAIDGKENQGYDD